MKKLLSFLTVFQLMAAFCLTASAEISDYEAVDSIDGVTIYYLSAGHRIESFGGIWSSGIGESLKDYALEGSLPEGVYLLQDERSLALAGEAKQAGEYHFTLTVRCASSEGDCEFRMECVCRVVDGPVSEALVFSDGHFRLISGESSPAAHEGPAPGYYAGTGMYARYADGSRQQLSDGSDMELYLYREGRACLILFGSSWWTHWNENGIYSEYGSLGKFESSGSRLTFGWEGGDGYYTYEFAFQGDGLIPAPCRRDESVSGFFDTVDYEPYIVHSPGGKHYGFESDFSAGCRVWCAVENYQISAEASSTLAPQGQYSYWPSNICNSDRGSAWVEGADGYGIGEYIEITRRYDVSDADFGVYFDELCVVNGYARTPEAWAANSRVKELKLFFNGAYVTAFTLADSIEPQYFDLTPYRLHADSGADSVFRFEIASVYPGEKYDDTVITGIELGFWTPNH